MDTNRGSEMISVDILHGTNHANIINHTSHVRKQVTHLDPTFPVGSEFPIAPLVIAPLPIGLVMMFREVG